MTGPLVSATMITADRPTFVAEAIESFLGQTWKRKELVIWDSGLKPIAIPKHPEIRVFRGCPGPSIGVLRNCANARSQGQVICHWDDDDFSFPERIEEQVQLLAEQDADVVGYRSMIFMLDDGRCLIYDGDMDMVCGTSLMYKRFSWQQRGFRDIKIGEDFQFVQGRRLVTANGYRPFRMIARVHARSITKGHRFFGDQWREPKKDPYFQEVASKCSSVFSNFACK